MDLAIIMDSSGKRGGERDWVKMVNFVRKFIRLLEISSDGVNVGIVTFSNSGLVALPLNRYRNIHNLTKAINLDNLPFKDQMTNYADAIRVTRTKFFREENGDRDSAPNVALLLAEGPSNREKFNIVSEARYAREAGITILAVGVTRWVKKNEIESITGDTGKDLITYLDNMEELDEAQDIVFNKLCQGKPLRVCFNE